MSEESLSRIEGLITSLRRYSEYRFDKLEAKVKTIESGTCSRVPVRCRTRRRISYAFGRLSDEIDSFKEETNKRLERLEHGQNRILANLDVILRHITGVGQEPPQE